MDLSTLSSINSQTADFLHSRNEMKNSQKNISKNNIKKTDLPKNKTASAESKIILSQKGQAGYMQQMDLDGDGAVSMEEFNKYCEKNGISGKDKSALLTAINNAQKDSKTFSENSKISSKIQKQTEESDSEETSEDEKNIYAKKGDDKYDENMDTNKNGVVTYAEYLEYLNKNNETSENSKESTEKELKIDLTASKAEDFEIKQVENTDSTVEIEV